MSAGCVGVGCVNPAGTSERRKHGISRDLASSAWTIGTGFLHGPGLRTRWDSWKATDDRSIILAPGFLREHNPVVRHTVLRRRQTLEEAGLLDKVGVEVHPNPQAPAAVYTGVGFSGLGID